ncbi:MAG: ATP-binding cassette domain-containing protein [Leptospiraceae bacterium]|nr:ATP-binding cassette domain-containing protein [Leptospiraceae bacterium]
MLEVQNLSRHFQSKIAVNSISFTVKPGRITGLLGPNGAGKTTTMRLITGYLQPTSGTIRYNGLDIQENLTEVQKELGYLPESAPLYPEMLVNEYLQFMAEIRGVSEELQAQQIQKVVEICELSTHLNVPIAQLSKGFKQRVALAGTLIHDPKLIILDEPTSGLDPNQISHIRNVIRNLAKDKILILSTHILQEVEDVCDDVIIINKGTIVANSSVQSLHSGFQVYVEAKTELEKLRQSFKNEIVLNIEAEPNAKPKEGYNSFLVSLKEDKPEEIFKVLANNGFVVREMRVYRRSLESIFEELTRG